MNLLEQSLWWILPAFLIAGFMVFAMVEFTALLMVRPSRSRRQPLTASELRDRLISLNRPGLPYRLVESKRADLEIEWNVVDASWYELYAKVKLTSRYRARMLLLEEKKQVRWFESLRTGSWFIGLQDGKLRFNGDIRWQWGYIDIIWRGIAYGIIGGFLPRIGRVYNFKLDTVSLKNDIAGLVSKAGWDFRPVAHPLKVNRRWIDRAHTLRPSWMDRISERWFWGSLYVGSFILFYIYIFVGILDAWAEDYTWANMWPAVAVGVGWWTVWLAITWLLAGLPKFLTQRKARSRTGR